MIPEVAYCIIYFAEGLVINSSDQYIARHGTEQNNQIFHER